MASWRSPTSASKRSPASSKSIRPIPISLNRRPTWNDRAAAYAACLHFALTTTSIFEWPRAKDGLFLTFSNQFWDPYATGHLSGLLARRLMATGLDDVRRSCPYRSTKHEAPTGLRIVVIGRVQKVSVSFLVSAQFRSRDRWVLPRTFCQAFA